MNLYTGHVFVWQTPAEAFHVTAYSNREIWWTFCDVVGAVSFRGLSPLIVLNGMIIGDHYRSVLADHHHLVLQTLFVEERSLFQDDNVPVHVSHCIQTWLNEDDDEVEHLTWCLQSPNIDLGGFFREQIPCLLSSSMQTT